MPNNPLKLLRTISAGIVQSSSFRAGQLRRERSATLDGRMTPEAFVDALLTSVRQSADAAAGYFAEPPVAKPPAHLGEFSAWFRGLSAADQDMAREVIRYAAEGSLFGLLTYLDNVAGLTDEQGTLELWFTAPDGARVRLNDPDGELLTDLFNNHA
jgi:hypothetical protein